MAMKLLGTLLTDAVDFCKRHFTALLVGAVVFGALQQGVTIWVFGSAKMPQWQQTFSTWQQKIEGTTGEMQALTEKVQRGEATEDDRMQLEKMQEQIGDESLQGIRMMGGFMRAMAPLFGIAFLLSALIGLIGKSYFLVVVVRNLRDVNAAASATGAAILPLIGMWLWIAIRSFVWIPFLGVILAIILAPRFLLTPLYLLEGKKGVLQSATLSYRATKGYWGKIVGNMIVAVVCSGILAAIVSGIVLLIAGGLIGGILSGIIGELMTAFVLVFGVLLARTVKEGARA